MEQLDKDILDWIAANSGNELLSAQLSAATVQRRDYTRTGFFLYLVTDPQLAAVEQGFRPVCPHIASSDLMDGAGCSLFLRDGRLHYLEVYARGGFLPQRLENYVLQQADDE